MNPDAQQSYSRHPEAEYFPLTACLLLLYSFYIRAFQATITIFDLLKKNLWKINITFVFSLFSPYFYIFKKELKRKLYNIFC